MKDEIDINPIVNYQYIMYAVDTNSNVQAYRIETEVFLIIAQICQYLSTLRTNLKFVFPIEYICSLALTVSDNFFSI